MFLLAYIVLKMWCECCKIEVQNINNHKKSIRHSLHSEIHSLKNIIKEHTIICT